MQLPSVPTQPGHPYAADGIRTGDGHGHCWGRNVEFCVTVGSAVFKTAGVIYSV